MHCQIKTINNMSNSEYLAQFNENDVINVFSEIIKADAPSISFVDRDVDIIDVEMFFDEHCVAMGEEGIADLIVNEYSKRAENYFGCVQNLFHLMLNLENFEYLQCVVHFLSFPRFLE